MRWFIRLLFTLLFIALFFFALNNADPVKLRLISSYPLEAPLVILLLVFTFFGMLLGMLAMVPRLLRYRKQINLIKAKNSSALSAADDTKLN